MRFNFNKIMLKLDLKHINMPLNLFQKSKILGECLMISSLSGKALRMLVDISRGLPSDSTCVLKA